MGLSYSYAFHNYESNRLIFKSIQTLAKYNVRQQTQSSYFNFGVIEHYGNFFMNFSNGVGIRLLHVKNDSMIPVSPISELERLSNYIEGEENGWPLLLVIKLSSKFRRKIKNEINEK